MPSRSHPALRGLLPLLAFAGAACAPRGTLWIPPASEPGAPAPEPGSRAPRTLTVAGESQAAPRREILVDARRGRTSIGHFHRGDRLHLRVLGGRWANLPGGQEAGPFGLQFPCVTSGPHTCAAGNGAAPMMAHLLFTKTPPEPPACAAAHRFFIPNGVEQTLPEDSFLFLAPNDWEDGMENNAGAVEVSVDVRARGGALAAVRRKLRVQATEPRSPLGRFAAGTRVSISVLGGTWSNDPGVPRVGPEGVTNAACTGGGAHTCAAGEGRAPMMGLVLVMASCEDGGVARPPPETRAQVGPAVELGVAHEGELFLGPNDWEDELDDNTGFLKVEITGPLAR
jgi:hypothetical protein